MWVAPLELEPKGWIQPVAVEEVAMKDRRCLIGRHEWHTEINHEGEPYAPAPATAAAPRTDQPSATRTAISTWRSGPDSGDAA
jgi:hypothetical protein